MERFKKENRLPDLDKAKFLVPTEISLGQFLSILRSRLHLPPSQSLYVLINGRSLGEYNMPMGAIYEMNRDTDGFLYFNYAAQEAFG